MSSLTDHYGEGCRAGNFRAQDWINDPKRGNPSAGGTLQHVILDLAEKLKSASGDKAISRARGEIVGFCYAVECSNDAKACLEYAQYEAIKKDQEVCHD